MAAACRRLTILSKWLNAHRSDSWAMFRYPTGGFFVDTLALFESLEAEGVPSKQAEAITYATSGVLNDSSPENVMGQVRSLEAQGLLSKEAEAITSTIIEVQGKMIQEANDKFGSIDPNFVVQDFSSFMQNRMEMLRRSFAEVHHAHDKCLKAIRIGAERLESEIRAETYNLVEELQRIRKKNESECITTLKAKHLKF